MNYLFLCPICFGIMAAFIVFEHLGQHKTGVILKGAASLVFVILGILGATMAKDKGYATMVVVGLSMGCIADVLLNLRFVFKERERLIFMAGSSVFLLGHVCYLVANVPRCNIVILFLVLGVALTGLLMWWIFKHITASFAEKVFGVVYVGAVVVLSCVALGALISSPSTQALLFLVGALLFLASDVVLILNTFGSVFLFSLRIANLVLYYSAQLLIALCLQFA